MYEVYVRDQYLKRVAEIDDYSLDMLLQFNDTSTWAIDIPIDVTAGYYLFENKSGIIIIRDGKTILSGPVTRRYLKIDEAGNGKMSFAGLGDTSLLKRNYAYPVPEGPPYTRQDYDVRTGPVESIILEYLDYNIGPHARPERMIPGLILAVDQGRGSSVTGRARFDTLIDLAKSLALAGGDLGFQIVQVGQNLEMQIYEPTDLTKTAYFSFDLGNARGFEYSKDDAEANYVIAAGQGDGAARTFVERGDSNSINNYGRIESFLDRRDTNDDTELNQSIDEELAQKSEKVSLSINPVDTDYLKFGRDYFLGDKVSVELTLPTGFVIGVIQDVVREVKITVNENGEIVTPSVGTPESLAANSSRIYSRLTKLEKRTSNLERR